MSQANLKKNSSRQEDMIYSKLVLEVLSRPFVQKKKESLADAILKCISNSILEKQPQFIFLKDELNFTIIKKYFKKFQITCVNRPHNE